MRICRVEGNLDTPIHSGTVTTLPVVVKLSALAVVGKTHTVSSSAGKLVVWTGTDGMRATRRAASSTTAF
jgi:hypothetical protein